MSTDLTRSTVSTDSESTEKLGELLGKRLKGGEVIELVSDLGGGKTTFVRGLASGAGSKDQVASPTFTLSKIYKADKLTIHHFDFYRLYGEAGIMEHEVKEAVHDPKSVVVIEWGKAVHKVLPKKHLVIKITNISLAERKLQFSCPKTLAYLLEDPKG